MGAALLVGLGAGTKLAPLALAVVWARAPGRWALLAPAVLVAGYLPFLDAGRGLFAGPATYLRNWDHPGLVHETLAWRARPGLARVVCLTGLARVSPGTARRAGSPLERTRACVAWALVLSPTREIRAREP